MEKKIGPFENLSKSLKVNDTFERHEIHMMKSRYYMDSTIHMIHARCYEKSKEIEFWYDIENKKIVKINRGTITPLHTSIKSMVDTIESVKKTE